MAHQPSIDGVLIQWGERLFYPGNRIVKSARQPKLRALLGQGRAAAIRARILATIVRRAPQVMVKMTGGGRGMRAIAAHFRYISKNGRLDIEDDDGQVVRGRDGVRELLDDWRFGGTLIEDVSDRREAFNIMLSMPRGTEPLIVLRAAREFARTELADHKYVMVLHDHQANPHVHISVRAESKHGKRLSPRKTDLHRWRETFAEKLRAWGVDAEATRQASRGALRNFDPIWRVKASADGRLVRPRAALKRGKATTTSRSQAGEAWGRIAQALLSSSNVEDQGLGRAIINFMRDISLERSPRLEQQEPPLTQVAPMARLPTVDEPGARR